KPWRPYGRGHPLVYQGYHSSAEVSDRRAKRKPAHCCPQANEKCDPRLDHKQTGLYTSGMARQRETSEARQRILETADRLCYQEGIRAVGIDRIVAEAGVAKMSLYKHFPSKDDLILAVLQYREQGVLEFFRSAMERHARKAKTPLRAFFAALKDWFELS